MTAVITTMTFNTITTFDNSSPEFILEKPIYSAEGYAVQNFFSTNSFYTIDKRNNKLSFSEENTPEVIRIVTIPNGNYTVNTFMTQLKTLLDAEGTAVYTVTKSDLTNLITISATEDFKILSIPNDVYRESGFTVSTSFESTQIATNVYDFSGLKVINIGSSNFGYNSIVVNKSLNIICSIPVQVPSLGVITYSPSPIFISTNIAEMNSVQFLLYDEHFRLITSNSPWQITLLFQI